LYLVANPAGFEECIWPPSLIMPDLRHCTFDRLPNEVTILGEQQGTGRYRL